MEQLLNKFQKMKKTNDYRDKLSEQSRRWLEEYRQKNPNAKQLKMSGEDMFGRIKRMRRLDHLKLTR